MSGLKVQCVEFRGLRKIYWQKWNVIIFILFSLMYNHRKLRIIGLSTLELVFHIYRWSRSFVDPTMVPEDKKAQLPGLLATTVASAIRASF